MDNREESLKELSSFRIDLGIEDMALKKINDDVIESVNERQKKLESLCDDFNTNISKLEGMTESRIILEMLDSLRILMNVTKDQIDFTRSGFDLFLSEIEQVNQRIERYHRAIDDDGR